MTGALGLFSLVDLFQLLSSSARSGRLGVDHPAGPARVYFDRGTVVHAEFANLKGDEAVYALFVEEKGTFRFTSGLPAPERTVHVGTENLILEAIRRLDESRRDLDPTAVEADMVPVHESDSERVGRLTLTASEVEVLKLIDGQRTVAQIAEMARFSIEDTILVVDRLIKVGALNVRRRKPRTARLVTVLTDVPLDANQAGVDANILAAWERTLSHKPDRIACRRPDGKVLAFFPVPVEGAGPFIHLSRDTLFRIDLAVNTALLVKPIPSGA